MSSKLLLFAVKMVCRRFLCESRAASRRLIAVDVGLVISVRCAPPCVGVCVVSRVGLAVPSVGFGIFQSIPLSLTLPLCFCVNLAYTVVVYGGILLVSWYRVRGVKTVQRRRYDGTVVS